VQPYPEWFEVLSRVYLAFSFLCGLLILSDEFIHPQKLASMNLVWPNAIPRKQGKTATRNSTRCLFGDSTPGDLRQPDGIA
jgi:hypothetical protein